jgi:putative membrane protein insertion efficiency factor
MDRATVRWPARIGIAAIRVYRAVASPLLPPACRFHPTCSEYAGEAIRRYGLAQGLSLAAQRLVRCRPGRRGGFDPVP